MALARGDFAHVLVVVDQMAEKSTRVGLRRSRIVALEIGLRALARLERWDDLLARAAGALEEAEQASFHTRTWRMLASRATARDARGDQAGARDDRAAARTLLDEMARRITDPELRAAFEGDPEVSKVRNG